VSSPGPYREDDAPGRIPESLIDAVLDGAVDDRTRREVARALRHDTRRRQELSETLEAINALREPVACPDLSGVVLTSLDRRHRFIPARVRRSIRQARLGLALAAMVALAGAAVAQRAVPRLASIGRPDTPVTDVAQAVTAEAREAAEEVRDGVRVMRASLPSLVDTLEVPGRAFHTDLSTERTVRTPQGAFRVVTIDGGRLVLVEAVRESSRDSRGGVVSLLAVSAETASDSNEQAGAGLGDLP
jgi:hypothetical protein